MARANTKIPIPPSQWVKDRQNKMPMGSVSTSSSTVAPVVVSPDTVSKKRINETGYAAGKHKGQSTEKKRPPANRA